jgi:CDP-diacylglycerol--glycerol-3-phosphate 3-phosphatidyltransferase
LTLANRITVARMGLSLAIFCLIVFKTFWTDVGALALLTVAAISDYLDGVVARRTMTTTPFGAIADPFADKILVMAVFLAFASIHELGIPLWAVFLILLRELTISTLRVLAALNGEVMKAEPTGKVKTFIQMTVAFIILTLLTLGSWSKAYTLPWTPLNALIGITRPVAWWLTVLTSAFTVISGGIYLSHHQELISKSWSERKH